MKRLALVLAALAFALSSNTSRTVFWMQGRYARDQTEVADRLADYTISPRCCEVHKSAGVEVDDAAGVGDSPFL